MAGDGEGWAKLAKKDVWQEYPAAMLRARAISECVRMACPEVLHGAIYTPEERGAVIDEDGNPVDAPVQPLRSVRAESIPPQQGSVTIDPGCFQPYAPAQEIARKAAKASARAALTALRDEAQQAGVSPDAGILAPDTEEPDTLRQYLSRRWKALPEQTGQQQDDGIVGDEPPVDEHAAAVAELRAFATEAGIDDIDADAYGALGAPLADVSPAAIRGLLAQLRGTAA
jgi:hypothetical protein